MKQNRDAAALAASLQTAATTPLPLPAHNQERRVAASSPPASPTEPARRGHARLRQKTGKGRLTPPETVGITLRPESELLNRYVLAAAERTRKEGKVISAQQIMLEVLATGPKEK
jgi:hypothetical protein